MIEKCPRCGESLASSTLGSTVLTCGRCSGAFMMAQLLASMRAAPLAEGAPAAPPAIALPRHFRERYEIGAPLGRGTMGLVFAGRDLREERDVAIKVLLSAADEDILARFLREAELLASVEHPHLVQVFDLDQLDGYPCLITEYLGGGTLRDRMTGPMPARTVVRIAAECCSALDACHAAGIVHRDLKPENILFGVEGNSKVADLGIAKVYGDGDRLTRTGAFIGTPRYMSPEQARGLPATASADVYSMGVMVYEMLAGARPLDGPGLRELLTAILTQAPPRLDDRVPGVPAALARAVDRALAKQPEERFATAGALGLALRRSLDPASGPLAVDRPEAAAGSARRRAAIRESAQRALASMQLDPSELKRLRQGERVATIPLGTRPPLQLPQRAATAPISELVAGAPVDALAPGAPPAAARGKAAPVATLASGAARVRSGDAAVITPSAILPGSGASAEEVRDLRAKRLALAGGFGVLMLGVGLGARALMLPAPGDPRGVTVAAGITGALISWSSNDSYAAAVRATGTGASAAAREERAGRDHRLAVSGLQEGGAYEVFIERDGRPAFPPLRVQLGRALEVPAAVAVTPHGPDQVEAIVEMAVPVTVVAAQCADPSISVDVAPGPTAPVRLVLRGPGAAAGFLDVELKVLAVCGATAGRTLRLAGAAERLRDYTASTRFVRDLEALDREIGNRRYPVAERELRAEARLQSFPALGRFAEDLPALQHLLTSEASALSRRARVYEVVSDLTVMEKLLEARMNVPEPGLSLARDSLVAKLVDARKAAEQLVPAWSHIPPAPRPASARSVLVAAYGKGALAARGPGPEDARAGLKQMAGGLVDVDDVIQATAHRGDLPGGLERIRLTLLGRCLESHLVLSVRINRTWRLRYFGSSMGIKAGRVAATDFLTSEAATEKYVPREELALDLPAGLLQPGDNQLEVTAQTLVAEMVSNTVFCTPLVHEIFWGPVP